MRLHEVRKAPKFVENPPTLAGRFGPADALGFDQAAQLHEAGVELIEPPCSVPEIAQHNSWKRDRIPRTRGAIYSTVRIDADGTTTFLHRGEWLSGSITKRGEVVGVHKRFKRKVLLGLDANGKRMFRRVFREPWGHLAVAAHATGVCTLGRMLWDPTGSATVACFDREAQLLWQRRVPAAGEWAVDDDGWVYVLSWDIHDDNPETSWTLSAIDPKGQTAWSTKVGAPAEMMLVGDDELCVFNIAAVDKYSSIFSHLVCVQPRHGQAGADNPSQARR